MKLRFTLRTRIAATVAIAVLGSMVAATAFAYELERRATEDRFIAAANAASDADYAQALDKARSAHGTSVSAVVGGYLDGRGLDSYAVVDSRDPTHPRCKGLCLNAAPASILRSVRDGAQNSAWADIGDRQLYLTIRVIERSGTAHVALLEYYDFTPARAQLTQLRRDLLALDSAGVAVAVALGLLVATTISRPVRRTAAAAQGLGAGDLDTRVPVKGSGELADLATSFNDMAGRLASTMNDLHASQTLQQRFVADVSHELRTPLAAMLAAVDGLDSDDVRARERSADLLGTQTRRVARMVDDLLEMSRFDAGRAALDLERTDLVELAHDVIGTVAPHDDVRVAGHGDVTTEVDVRRIHTILRNLVGNAMQHGTPPVDVLVTGQSDAIIVTVADDGPGIDPAISATIFDRFVRADTARGSGGASTGLGLSIAMENARLHGGRLTASGSGRTAFSLWLPRRTAS